MTNLFVDVDDTLILYDKAGPNPYGVYQGTPFAVNQRLLEGIRDFRHKHPDALVVVWSGGGRDYADMWLSYVGLNGVAIPLGKDKDTMGLVKGGDVVVDDSEDFVIRTHGPTDWPEPTAKQETCPESSLLDWGAHLLEEQEEKKEI